MEGIQDGDGATADAACRHCWRDVFREKLYFTKYFHIYVASFC